MSEPDLPKDPAEYRPKPLMGWTFWVMLAFGTLCVLAGAGVALLLPKLLPPPPAAAPAPPPRTVSGLPGPAPDLPLAYADAGPKLTEPVLYPVEDNDPRTRGSASRERASVERDVLALCKSKPFA